ncbi:TlpA disulfide reductase family protein [Methylophaga sp.]|uniref:TlpA family protein disulfide reductase n=1 Tax=Methylophaga sp. TaxID=2024840 RepID=UPI002727B8E2|nr:TlpA disulfide reductase family protein [Methylophaga sp.]MDO8827528.1 TlpA disulfide reductase family protein [Methylophaga sp.]
MMSINIGPFAIPLEPLLLFGSGLFGILVASFLARKKEGSVTDPLLMMLLFGLVIGRIVFVIRFADQYDSFWRMLDFRDRGVDWVSGMIAMVLFLLWQIKRLPQQRIALFGGALSILLFFSVTSFMLNAGREPTLIPDVSLERLDGEQVSLNQFAGENVTVVNLWASWCPPCQREMPAFEKSQQQYADIRFVMLNQQESAETIEQFLTDNKLTFDHVLLDKTGKVADIFNAYGLPVTLFFDQQGMLVESHMGEVSAASLSATLQRLSM